MKKTLSFMVMAFALLFAQCRKPEVKFPTPSAADEGTTVSMTVTAGPGSKTDITTAGGITWSSGDRLYVGDGTKYVGYLTLVSGQNTPTGTFSGDVTLTGITESTPHTFGFYYLGSAERTLTVGATSAVVDFSSQEIYADVNNKLVNASAQHVGYGTASGTVKDGIVTGINVTLVSKVALARFSFTEAAGKGAYTGPLTLSGTGIYNSMTVGFGGTFDHGTTAGNINLGAVSEDILERYVMLVPVGSDSEILNFGGGATGSTTLENGIEANKFYGKSDAIAVSLHEYVDLGLPSGLLWATCNLGAEHPYDYGDYYAWGETAPYIKNDVWCEHPSHDASITFDEKVGYGWKNYLDGGHTSWDISYEWTTPPYDATTKILTSDYDAATANWGSGWRMPTTEEWKSLYESTTNVWTDNYNNTGVAGRVFTSTDGKGNELFLPAAGRYEGTTLCSAGYNGRYWSSSLLSFTYNGAYFMFFERNPVYPEYTTSLRSYGYSVRPVRLGR